MSLIFKCSTIDLLHFGILLSSWREKKIVSSKLICINRQSCLSTISFLFLSCCPSHERQVLPDDLRLSEIFLLFVLVCKALVCSNDKTCMIEDGLGVCRCLFNCSSEENKVKEQTS
jgi:hypothetical protein